MIVTIYLLARELLSISWERSPEPDPPDIVTRSIGFAIAERAEDI